MKALLSTLILTACVAIAQAQTGVNIGPTRLTLTNDASSGFIAVVNRSNEPVRYRLKLVDMIMDENGVVNMQAEPTANSASKLIRFAPREFTVAPGELQKIRVFATYPPDLPHGEFRSHLAFEPILDDKPAAAEAEETPGKLKLDLRMRTAITMPLFVINGQLSGEAKVAEPHFVNEGAGWKVRFLLKRSGAKTVRGTCVARFTPASGGPATVLGRVLELPVYYPNDSRNVDLDIATPPAKLGDGTLEVTFVSPGAPASSASVKVKAGG